MIGENGASLKQISSEIWYTSLKRRGIEPPPDPDFRNYLGPGYRLHEVVRAAYADVRKSSPSDQPEMHTGNKPVLHGKDQVLRILEGVKKRIRHPRQLKTTYNTKNFTAEDIERAGDGLLENL
jgi:hypothetical protein